MPSMRSLIILALSACMITAALSGCGSEPSSPESTWREEVDGSMRSLESSTSYHYQLNLERWIGVSGQSIYGDEEGEGSYAEGDFSVQLLRRSPAGDETFVVASIQGQLYMQEDNQWNPISMEENPSPLCYPGGLCELVAGYGSIFLEGEEDRGSKTCRRYLLQLSNDRARDAFSPRAWSYFSNLRYEINCRIWTYDAASPPASMQLEVVGFDQDENLQRYRLLATMDPYDIDSPDVRVSPPDILEE